jgi:fatty-acyl-CoA synthase
MTSPYEIDLGQVAANHQPLTPLGLLARTAAVHPHHTAVIHGDWRYDYRELYARWRAESSLATRSR